MDQSNTAFSSQQSTHVESGIIALAHPASSSCPNIIMWRIVESKVRYHDMLVTNMEAFWA